MRTTVKLRLFNHVLNPAVRSAVRHRPHGRLAGAVALLTYQGRVSGRVFTVPVEYVPAGATHYLIVPGDPDRKTWWRNFRQPTKVRLLVGGRDLSGTALLLTNPAERRAALELYFHRFPLAARSDHLAREADGSFDPLRLAELTEELVAVCVTLDEE